MTPSKSTVGAPDPTPWKMRPLLEFLFNDSATMPQLHSPAGTEGDTKFKTCADERCEAQSMPSFVRPRLIVHDPDAAIDFYQQTLGVRLDSRIVEGGIVVDVVLSMGGDTFTLAAEVHEWGLFSPLTVGGSASLVTLGVTDARATAQAMVAAGAETIVPIEDRPYGRCEGRIRDPFGHLWVPTHDLPHHSSSRVCRIVADLPGSDPAKSAEFYQELLGLRVVMDHGWVVALAPAQQLDRQLMILAQDQSAAMDPQVSIEVDDLDLVWRRAAEIGAEIVYPRTNESWGVERFFVRDPAGNIINLLAHHAAND